VQLLEQAGVKVITVTPETMSQAANSSSFNQAFDQQAAALFHSEASH